MKKISFLFIVVVTLFVISCAKESTTEVYHEKRDNTIDITEQLIDIDTDLLVGRCYGKIVADYYLVNDIQSLDKGFHLFDKKTLKYITSTGTLGQGPGEVGNYAQILFVPDDLNNAFYAFDYSKLVLYHYSIDSVITGKKYLPKKVINMNPLLYGRRMSLLDDSTFLGKVADVVNNHTVKERIAKFNICSGEVTSFGYENPKLKTYDDFLSDFVLSRDKKLYVCAYCRRDLMTVCNLKGELLYNIYGQGWDKNLDKPFDYYGDVAIYKDKIIASFLGRSGLVLDKYKRTKGVLPDKFLVFDLKGNYIKTLDPKEQIRSFCVDEQTERMYISFRNRDNGLAYLDLKGLVD